VKGAKRVEGEINDHPVNLALTKAPVTEQTFLYAGKDFLKQCDITPGALIDVRLRKADPNIVDTPEDVMLAIGQADRTADWDALTAGKKRGMLHSISTAKRVETRQKRISALLKDLAAQ